MKKFISQIVWAGIAIILLLVMFFLPGNASAQTGDWNVVSTTNSPNARHECSFVQLGDKFYLVGGRGILPVDQYNPGTSTWNSLNNPPQEIHHFQATEFHGLMYVICAFEGTFPIETGIPFVYIYDPLTDTWVEGIDIPSARVRGSAGVVLRDDKFYVVSGITNGHQSGWVTWFDEYDPATNAWNVLPDAPNARDHFAAVLAGDDHLVCAGGRRSGDGGGTWDSVVHKTDIYDFVAGSWATLASPSGDLPTPRAGTSAAFLDGEVLIIGGETATQWPAHEEVEALDPATGTWRAVDALNDGRHGSQAIVSNNGIYICAGAGSRGCCPELNDMESFHFGPVTAPGGTALTAGSFALGGSPVPATEPGASSTAEVTLFHNSGNQAILIQDIRLTGDAEFTLSSTFEFPFALAPGKTLTIPLNFAPSSGGTYSADLAIDHGAVISTTNVPVSGVSASCDATSAPTGLSSTAQASSFLLTWDEVLGAEKCQVQGRVAGTTSFAKINVNIPPQQFNLPYAALSSGVSYEWKVRCACTISPLDATPFSGLSNFTAPAASPLAREGYTDMVSIYPNPAEAFVTVQTTPEKSVYVELTDLLGRAITAAQSNGKVQLETASLQPGVYFVLIDGKQASSPVVVQ